MPSSTAVGLSLLCGLSVRTALAHASFVSHASLAKHAASEGPERASKGVGSAAASLACKVRQVGLDYAQSLQGDIRPKAAWTEVADALNGADDAKGCIVTPRQQQGAQSRPNSPPSRVLSYPVPSDGMVIYVDAKKGSDDRGKGSGEKHAPFASLPFALAQIRFVLSFILSLPLGPRIGPRTYVLKRGRRLPWSSGGGGKSWR
jgi:hypothetical protein